MIEETSYTQKSKVFAYITRKRTNTLELLIFAHRDFPEAGLQVPAGTIESKEEKINALKREVEEESGLTSFQSIKFLGEQKYVAAYKNEIHTRYFYQLNIIEENATEESPATFQHIVTDGTEDKGLVFDYEWVSLNQLPKLIAEHDSLIHLIE